MRLNFTHKISLLTLCATLAACGGSGGSGSSNSNTPAAVEPDVETAAEALVEPEADLSEPEPPRSTSELMVSEEFVVDSTTKLDLVVDIEELRNERAYLNVCHEDNSGNTDYNNCALRTPLTDGYLLQSLSFGNEVNSLIAEIWRYDVDSQTIIRRWTKGQGVVWEVN